MANSDRGGDNVLDQIRDDVRRVMDDPLHWFPVRHHSPAAARHIRRVILDRKPKVVFVEGPSEANDLVPFVTDAKTKPPVALYSSYRDDDNLLGLAGIASAAADIPARFASWYPLMEYSPEYIAMQSAARIGADLVFIDLPHFGLLQPPQESGEPSSDPSPQLEDDRLLVESDFYQTLAATAGFKTWSETWDSLFEFGDYNDEAERFRYELATFCAAARQTASSQRIASDGTLERERFMRQTIRTTLAERGIAADQAMVVCGGFHLFMDHDDDTPPPELPAGTVYTSVVPYSFFQVSELSGYGAGNRAPRFFQSAWELGDQPGNELLAHHVVTTLKLARREGQAVSSADAISVCQHASMLAALRGRGGPILDDIHDAIMTCCCKGDPIQEGFLLRRAIDQADIGTKIGSVTDKLGRLPLLNDFYGCLDSLDLEEVVGQEKQVKVSLDTRDELDQERSAFFQRLRFMKVPVCELLGAGNEFSSGTIFKEVWRLKWSPQVDASLVERNLYGDQVESASLAMLREQIRKDDSHAGRTCGRLRQAMEMQLPGMIRELSESCETSIEEDPRFISLAEAAMHLNVLRGHPRCAEDSRSRIAGLLVHCFQRGVSRCPSRRTCPRTSTRG